MAVPEELRHENMQALVTRNKDTANHIRSTYYPEEPNDQPGTTIKYEVLEYQEGLARHVARDARPPERDLPTRNVISYEAPTIKEAINLPATILKDARAPGTLNQSQRDSLIARAVRQTRKRMETRIEWWCAQWFTAGALLSATGSVPGDADGNIYLDYPAASAVTPLSASMGFSATHLEANVHGTTSWADPTADIKADLDHALGVIQEDFPSVGRGDVVVAFNENTHAYIEANNAVFDLIEANPDLARQYTRAGVINELWGYEFDIYNGQWTIDTDSMNDDAGTEYFIPNNVVVMTVRDNERAARSLLTCEPIDADAPAGARGMYAWTDEDPYHPHTPRPAMELTAGPQTKNPDTTKIYKDVTST